jgi:hypothetical protein
MRTRSQSLISSISEAIVAHLTFESKCGMGEVYCEQMLYGPIQRVASHLNWRVRCEVPVGKKGKSTRGDHRRIDFMFVDCNDESVVVGLEVKFAKKRPKRLSRKIRLDTDLKKLATFKTEQTRQKKRKAETYIIIIGRASVAQINSIHTGKSNKPKRSFILTEGQNKMRKDLTEAQVETCFKTSNTHFLASRVRV